MPKEQKSILLITEWPDPRFLRGVARYARSAGWHVGLDYVYGRGLPWGWKGDGCLASSFNREVAEFTASLEGPVVDLYVPRDDRPYSSICEDNVAIGRMAAEYFLGRGFQHYACYFQDLEPFSAERMGAFSERVSEEGFAVHPMDWGKEMEKGRSGWAARQEWLAEELQKFPQPLAVFCQDDQLAVSVIEVCREVGLEVPHQIAVMGVGDLELAGDCSPVPLSSVRIDFEEFGYRAAALLDQVMAEDGKGLHAERVAPTDIVERTSSSTLALSHPEAMQIARMWLENFAEPEIVSTAMEAVGMTRRQFGEVTRRELGLSPAKLLEVIRLHKAFDLLANTDYTVDGIASMTGLHNRVRLQRIFRARFGMTPGEWRKFGGQETDTTLPGLLALYQQDASAN